MEHIHVHCTVVECLFPPALQCTSNVVKQPRERQSCETSNCLIAFHAKNEEWHDSQLLSQITFQLDLNGRLPNTSSTLVSKISGNCCSELSFPMYWVRETLEWHRKVGSRPDLS